MSGNEGIQFDRDKFMEEQWARLAAMYGVSVEEVKSKEFDERLERELEEQRNREATIDKRENAEIWREIRNGGIFAGIVAAFGWIALSPHRWWFPISSVIVAFFFISLEEEAIKQVKRKDYPNAVERYWKQVHDALMHFHLMAGAIVFTVLVFLLFALGNRLV